MSEQDIIRAWKDRDYRASLSEEERALLPENPAGSDELSDEISQTIAGGAQTSTAPGSGCGTGHGTGCGTGGNCTKCDPCSGGGGGGGGLTSNPNYGGYTAQCCHISTF